MRYICRTLRFLRYLSKASARRRFGSGTPGRALRPAAPPLPPPPRAAASSASISASCALPGMPMAVPVATWQMTHGGGPQQGGKQQGGSRVCWSVQQHRQVHRLRLWFGAKGAEEERQRGQSGSGMVRVGSTRLECAAVGGAR